MRNIWVEEIKPEAYGLDASSAFFVYVGSFWGGIREIRKEGDIVYILIAPEEVSQEEILSISLFERDHSAISPRRVGGAYAEEKKSERKIT